MSPARLLSFGALLAILAVAGCGGSSKPAATTTQPTTATSTTTPTPTNTQTSSSPSALQAEANSAAAGDIPDNQVFLTFGGAKKGWSMKYPEGWAQSGSPSNLVFRDKNNIVRVVVSDGSLPTVAAIRNGLLGVQIESGPQKIAVSGAPAMKIVYTTQSAPSSVTGKRVTLIVDRYYFSHGSKEAIVDLGTPVGVDNVDAYRMMIESFTWK